MIVYIKAQAKVKGVTRDVFYVGTVQDDGYIYFNDEMMYRMTTPPNMQGGMSYLPDNVQIWYTVRNCWIRANYFTNMQIVPIDLEAIAQLDQRVTTLENTVNSLLTRVQTAENRVFDLLGWLNELGHDSIGDNPTYGYGNGDSLLTLWNAVVQIITDTGSSATLPTTSIFTTWNDKQFP